MINVEWVLLDTETNGLKQPIFVVEIGAQKMLGWEKQGRGNDEEDDNGSGDGDEQGNEDSASHGGDSTIQGGDSKPDMWLCRGRDLTWTREHRTPRRQ